MTLYNEQLNTMASMPRIPYKTIGLGAAGLAGIAGLYGANTIDNPSERWDRTAINTAGNIIGGAAGYMLGGPVVAALGALGGGYASDRVADMFDPTGGIMSEEKAAIKLLNQHLDVNSQPYLNEAEARAELAAARQAQKEQAMAIRAYREQMMQQYGQ